MERILGYLSQQCFPEVHVLNPIFFGIPIPILSEFHYFTFEKHCSLLGRLTLSKLIGSLSVCPLQRKYIRRKNSYM